MAPRSGPLPFALTIAITNAWVSQLFDQELERRGVTPFQSGTLMMLHRLQPVTPSDLQAVMGLPGTTVRNRVNELVAAGLVERMPHPHDGRSHLLRTTTAAADILKASDAAARQVQRTLVRSGVDVAGLSAQLDELRSLVVDASTASPGAGRGSLTTGPW